MTLEKAIETLETLEGHHVLKSWSQSRDGLRLGIEALKRLKINRDIGGKVSTYLLPGETKE